MPLTFLIVLLNDSPADCGVCSGVTPPEKLEPVAGDLVDALDVHFKWCTPPLSSVSVSVFLSPV